MDLLGTGVVYMKRGLVPFVRSACRGE